MFNNLIKNFIKEVLLENERATFNKGDIAEGILGAALVAKFIKEENNITANDVWDVIQSLDTQANQSLKPKIIKKNVTFELPSFFGGKKNTITLTIGLSKNNFEGFVDQEIFDSIGGIVTAAIKFASSSAIKNIIRQIEEDKRSNHVEVSAVGLEDQKGTKADLKITVDGKPVPYGTLSLKAGSTKQLGQIGKGWEGDPTAKKYSRGIVDLFKALFGITIDSELRSEYIEAIQNGGYDDVVSAIKSVYEDAFNKISARFEGGKKELQDFLITLANGIKYEATLNEEGVILLNLGNKDFKALNFDKLFDLFQDENKELDIEVSYSFEERLPKISISVSVDRESYGPIISIRPKIRKSSTGGIGEFRHYVEKEAGLTKLISLDLS